MANNSLEAVFNNFKVFLLLYLKIQIQYLSQDAEVAHIMFKFQLLSIDNNSSNIFFILKTHAFGNYRNFLNVQIYKKKINFTPKLY